jgi:hypothetical protein
MKSTRLMAFAVAITVIVVAMIVAGCTTTSTPTPTPVPTPTPAPSATPTPVPTATPVPANQTVENTYQFVERYAVGIENHNNGVGFVKTAQNLFNESDYTNASSYMDKAADRMDAAKANFESMLWYASTSEQTLLSQKWTEAADLYAKSYRNASLAYKENAYESTKQTPNYVKVNYYMQLAQQYNDQATEVRKEAETIGDRLVFVVPTSTPVP